MNPEKIPFWRDERIRGIAVQALVVLIVVIIFAGLGNNFRRNFQELGITFGFNFLSRPASFAIGDTLIDYSSLDTYSRAILVGLLNSLRVIIIGIFLATIVGVIVGIGRLSENWLVRQLASIYVQTLRNTPLLLQLFFWYFAIFLKLPKIEQPLIVWDAIFLTNRGMDIPFPAGTAQTWITTAFLLLNPLLLLLLWRRRNRVIEQQGRSGKIWGFLLGLGAIALIIALVWGLDWRFPQLDPDVQIITGGVNLSPEFATILFGLTFYTAAFIAEVVRGGIQSVSKGQWEAAQALGLNSHLTLRLVVFPQALRVIIPPLTSEFLNLAKNSSLAIAIGYNDIYGVSATISNQTGRSVEMLLLVMFTYLAFNLFISLGMNWFNSLVQIKER